MLIFLLAFACCGSSARAGDHSAEWVQRLISGTRVAGDATLYHYGAPVYAARLFVGAGAFSPERLDHPFALRLRFAQAVRGRALAEDFGRQMRDMGLAKTAEITDWQLRLGEILPDCPAGSSLILVYLPTGETRIFLSGTRYGTIEGREFAHAFFGLWLDPSTAMPGLREGLLAHARN